LTLSVVKPESRSSAQNAAENWAQWLCTLTKLADDGPLAKRCCNECTCKIKNCAPGTCSDKSWKVNVIWSYHIPGKTHWSSWWSAMWTCQTS